MASKSKKGDHKSHQKPTIQAKNTSSAAGQQYKPGKQASIPTSNLTGTSKNKNNKSAKTMVPSGLDFIDHVDRFLTKRHTFFFFLSIGLAILFSVLLFDFKVGPGGDDSAYLMRSYDFVHGFVYPGYQGPLYPVILSPFIWMFGIQLTLLKILSLIFMIIALNFFYKTFYNRIPATILTISFLLICIDYFVLYFSSQTYSEAFFLMILFIFFWFFTSRFIDKPTEEIRYREYLLLGLLLFLLSITKNIAVFSIIVILGYFVVYKRWKDILGTFVSFGAFFGLFEIIKRLLWPGQGFQLSGQGSGLMYKDFYNPTMGKEDFAGFIQRFIDNSNLYLSKHLFKFLGLVNESSIDINPFLTVVIYGLIAIGLLFVFRKNKLIFLAGSYILIMCSLIFISVQKHWDQWRLIIIFYPFFLIILFSAFYYLFKRPSLKGLQFLIPVLGIILIFTEFNVTTDHVKSQHQMLIRNMEGDMLYGLTPDWTNYIKMSQWAASHVPRNENIGCRKPDISFVYGGRKYYYIGKVPSITIDSIEHLMTGPGVYIGIGMQKFVNTKIFADPSFKMRTVGFVNGNFSFGNENVIDGNVVGIYYFSADEFPVWQTRLNEAGIYYEPNIKSWVSNIQHVSKEYAVFLPDMLLDQLKTNHVKYLILASLRMNPTENNGSIISTLHRYVYFIQLKYPTVFREIYKIGDEETASLYEGNFN